VPARRGAGVGRRLLTAVVDAARAAGCRAIDLEVDETHARAANLYEREGFRKYGRTRFGRKLGG